MIKIILPKESQGRLSTAIGAKVFDEDGKEIKDICSFTIKGTADSILTASIEIPVSSIS